jgi:ribosomal protein S18 acetylase RimI-like enzyme
MGVRVIRVRPARQEDISCIKKLVDVRPNKRWLGFVSTAYMASSIAAGELHVATSGRAVVGFIRWHRRRDGWTSIYEICVDERYRQRGVGRKLVDILGKGPVRLKCHWDNQACVFYRRLMFSKTGEYITRRGKLLNVFERSTISQTA